MSRARDTAGIIQYNNLTIDSNNAVGIGSSMPDTKFDINGGLRVTGIGTFENDVQIADKIVHTGDTDTAIRFPAADTFTVETGGSERIRVSSAGSFAIGTDSPAIPLDVHGADTNANGLGDVKGQLRVFNDTTAFGSSPRAGIVFSTKYRTSPDVPLDGAAIYGGKENSSDADKDFFLAFATRDESPNEAVERMRISSSGNLGIGTDSPQYLLDIADGNASARLNSTSTSTLVITSGSSSAARIEFGDHEDNDIGKIYYDNSDNSMQFSTNTSEALRITSDGKMGVGNASPHVDFEVGSNDDDVATIAVRYSTVPGYFNNSFDGTNGLTSLSNNKYSTADGSTTWSSSANTSYATAAFQLLSSTGGSQIKFLTAGSVNTDPTERMRITGDGSVRIVADNQKLKLGASDDFEIYHDGTDNVIGTDGPNIRIGTTGETFAKFVNNGAAELYHDNSKTFETTSTGALVQRPSGDVSLSIGDTTNSDGHLVLTAKSSSIELHGRSNHPINILFNTVQKASIGVDGTISDNIGPLRRLGITAVSGTGNLSASDAGKLLRSTGTITLTIPSGTFTAGDMITIFNVGTGNITIAQGSSTTLYNTADASTGNRTLAAKGMATIACTASNEFVISGSNLS